MNPERPRVPEAQKQPGVAYALTDDGLELPVLDVTHPAFDCELDDAAYAAAVDAFLREAKQRAKDEAARQAREEAEQRQREAQEALRSSDSLVERVEAEERLKQAAKLTAVANKIDRSATGLRTNKRVELTDPTAFGRWAWEHRRDAYVAALTNLAEKERDNLAPIPGIIIHHEKKAA